MTETVEKLTLCDWDEPMQNSLPERDPSFVLGSPVDSHIGILANPCTLAICYNTARFICG